MERYRYRTIDNCRLRYTVCYNSHGKFSTLTVLVAWNRAMFNLLQVHTCMFNLLQVHMYL